MAGLELQWVPALRRESRLWDALLADLDRIIEAALEAEHQADHWETVLKHRGEVEGFRRFKHTLTMDLQEEQNARAYHRETGASLR